jgi:hypothetical protein
VASPCPACRVRERPSAVGVDRGVFFGDGGRVALVPGHDIDLVDLDLTLKGYRRDLSGEPCRSCSVIACTSETARFSSWAIWWLERFRPMK